MTVCHICDGVGLVRVVDASGRWVSRPCECQTMDREKRRLAAAQIPAGYLDCTLDLYETSFPWIDPSLAWALKTARSFVDAYPVDTSGKGLLLVGPHGVGKTHLAVGVLRRLIQERGARGIFRDYGALIKQIQQSYNPRNAVTEFDLLDPVLKCEVLVLDDVGAQKPTDWIWDNIALILNTRYNNRLTTIVTTNFADLPPCGGELSDIQKSAREQTLGDRIGERMRSRLAEMCVRVDMVGKDFRQSVKRARFG